MAFAVVLTAVTVIFTQMPKTQYSRTNYDIKNFGSYQDFTSFLAQGSQNFNYRYSNNQMFSSNVLFTDELTKQFDSTSETLAGTPVDFSKTNIQIEGVDEPDIVKTDGTYLYVVSNNRILIIRAYPPQEAEILGTITLDINLTIRNIFISGNRLVIFAESYTYPILYEEPIKTDEIKDDVDISYSSIAPWYSSPDTYIQIYDIEDKRTPVITKNIIVGGSFTDARLIHEYIYVITTQYTYNVGSYIDDKPIIPRLLVNDQSIEVPLTDIYYVDNPEKSNTVTNIVSVNIQNDAEEVHQKIFLIGSSQTIFVSQNNIYIAASTWYYDYTQIKELVDTLVTPLLSESVKSQLETVQTLDLEDYQKTQITQWIIQKHAQTMTEQQKNELVTKIVEQTERTIIHRISINDGEIIYEAQGSIPGYVQNQFSFNEHNGYLQVSTTVHGSTVSYYIGSIEPRNNVYVLDMQLTIVGSVKNIAEGETIYATRFIGDKCYLVTFKQIDPFFVIDLAEPTNPVVLGELKIPGYSTYLHPYDETHLIGIGRDGSSVKISLFDVSDMTNPIELTNYTITKGETYGWTDSSALYEHKAFLFDKEKELLVLPVGNYNKQTAYVFSISLTNDIELRGSISHDVETTKPEEKHYYYYYDSGNSIQRAFYIENTLYTISTNMVKMNDLTTLLEINSIPLI